MMTDTLLPLNDTRSGFSGYKAIYEESDPTCQSSIFCLSLHYLQHYLQHYLLSLYLLLISF